MPLAPAAIRGGGGQVAVRAARGAPRGVAVTNVSVTFGGPAPGDVLLVALAVSTLGIVTPPGWTLLPAGFTLYPVFARTWNPGDPLTFTFTVAGESFPIYDTQYEWRWTTERTEYLWTATYGGTVGGPGYNGHHPLATAYSHSSVTREVWGTSPTTNPTPQSVFTTSHAHTRTYDQQSFDLRGSWSATWGKNGRRTDTDEFIQGYFDDTQGLQWGAWAWPDVTGELAGSRIDHVEAWFYANHWYYTTGGTARIGWHGSLLLPANHPGINAAWDIPGWPRDSGRWVDLNHLAAGIQSGQVRGMAVSSLNSFDRIFYGRFAGVSDVIGRYPALRAYYTANPTLTPYATHEVPRTSSSYTGQTRVVTTGTFTGWGTFSTPPVGATANATKTGNTRQVIVGYETNSTAQIAVASAHVSGRPRVSHMVAQQLISVSPGVPVSLNAISSARPGLLVTFLMSRGANLTGWALPGSQEHADAGEASVHSLPVAAGSVGSRAATPDGTGFATAGLLQVMLERV